MRSSMVVTGANSAICLPSARAVVVGMSRFSRPVRFHPRARSIRRRTMDDEISIRFECVECGGTILEPPDDHTDDTIAKCKTCGQSFGRRRDVQAKAREVAAEELRCQLAGAFKGLKGWKVE
ncbi:ECs_2282 family putative zinc-binding protein [Xanthobacter autotrophicus]